MTLTGTRTTKPVGTLALTWTTSDAPVRHRHQPQNISEGRHRD